MPYAIVVLFAYIGFSLPLPILPAMFLDPQESIVAGFSFHEKMIALGFMMASFPCGQFFGSPIIGHLSDRQGRKKIILLSLGGSLLGYLITAYSVWKHWLSGMFLGLALCGFCEGNVTIGQSVVVDLTNEQERKARHFGLLNACISLGFIIGPLMGGQLVDPNILPFFSYSTPFWIAAVMTVIGMLVIFFNSTETLQRKQTQGSPWNFFSTIVKGFKQPKLPQLYLANFFLALGYFSFFRFLPVFLNMRFSFSPSYLSFVMVYGSIAMIITALWIVPILARTFSSLHVLATFATLFASAVLLCIWPTSPYALWVTILLTGICLAVVITNGSLLLSNAASLRFQGQALGTLTSVQVLAEVLTGIFGGMIASEQETLPLIIGAAMSVIAAVILIWNKKLSTN